MALYPWQEKSWQQFISLRANLPHALLLTGEAGIGKRRFAEHLAQYLLCESSEKSQAPCGECVACGWFEEKNHPDFRVLSVDEARESDEFESSSRKKNGQWITVDAIRTLNDFMHIGAHRAGMRVVLVYPAEMMNVAGSNALLKMLEEPPAGLIFILVSHRWQRLLATIKSRCRRFALPTPAEEPALTWLLSQQIDQPQTHLRHCGGAPLKAYAQAHNTVQSEVIGVLLNYLSGAQKWNVGELVEAIDKLKVDTVDVIDCLQKWVFDHVLYQRTGKIRYYPDYQAALERSDPLGFKVWHFHQMLVYYRRYALHPLNQHLLLEKIFYSWIDVLKEARKAKD